MGCWELISLPDHQKSEKHNILNKPMELPFISHQKSAMKAAIIERLLGFKTNAPDSAVRQTWPCPWRNGNGSHGGSWKVSRPNNQRILVLKGQRWLVVSSIFFHVDPENWGKMNHHYWLLFFRLKPPKQANCLQGLLWFVMGLSWVQWGIKEKIPVCQEIRKEAMRMGRSWEMAIRHSKTQRYLNTSAPGWWILICGRNA